MISDVAASGDRVETLKALRDRLAADIDQCDSKRDMAALSARLMEVLERLDAAPKSEEVSPADEVARRRASRGQKHA